jgi:diguanylate cyclase (GGDEF)-like protein
VTREVVRRRLFAGYLVASLLGAAAHGFLPAGVRPVSYFLVALGTVPAITYGVRHCPRHGRHITLLLLTAMVVLSSGNLANIVVLYGSPAWHTAAELLITVGHVFLLAAALAFVRIRGRSDVGGLIDVAVLSMGLGGLLWTAMLQPRLDDLGISAGSQAGLLFNILVLTGILGALLRLAQTAESPILALKFIIYSLVTALIGDVILAMITGALTGGRPAALEAVFLASYALVGATGLHPSLHDLAQPGPAPTDNLTKGRLAFLGAALALSPVAGAGRQLFGLPVDGVLLAAGTVTTVPLVMTRIGYLAGQRVRAEQELVRQATHDALTGLTNRAEFIRRLDAALARRAAGGPLEVLVLFCDLDGFKAVNDRLGHSVGDDLLVAVARRLSSAVARTDTLARYGGDEFLILCETGNPLATQASLSRRVTTTLAHPFDLATDRVSVGVSIGAVVADADATADSVISEADAAMYATKQSRRRHLRSA